MFKIPQRYYKLNDIIFNDKSAESAGKTGDFSIMCPIRYF